MLAKKAVAAEKCVVNYNFYIGATNDNLEVCNEVSNVPGIKIFAGSSTGNMLVNDPEKLDAFFATGDRLIAVHSEDENMVQANAQKYAGSTDVSDHMKVRSPEAAIACTRFLVDLAIKYRRRLHILHLTTQEEAEFLATIIPEHPYITTEVCVQHLLCTAPEVYERHGTFAQINPPLRDQRHADALWKALKAGIIGNLATDHAPHLIEEKQAPYGSAPCGMPGVETALPAMLNLVNQGEITLQQVVAWMCTGPARSFNIPLKGSIEPGYDADLTLVNLSAKRKVQNSRLQTKCKWSIFEGQDLTGWPIATIVGGQLVYREGDFLPGAHGQEVQFS
jgi:dihydroorotase